MDAVAGRMSPVNTRQVKVDFLPHDLVYFLLNEDTSIISQISLCSAASAALQHQCGVHRAGGNILIKYFNKMINKGLCALQSILHSLLTCIMTFFNEHT